MIKGHTCIGGKTETVAPCWRKRCLRVALLTGHIYLPSGSNSAGSSRKNGSFLSIHPLSTSASLCATTASHIANPVLPPFLTSSPSQPTVQNNGSIRDQLRSWAIEHAQQATRGAENASLRTSSTRAPEIPQTLWLEETQRDDINETVDENEDMLDDAGFENWIDGDDTVDNAQTRIQAGDVVIVQQTRGQREVVICLARSGRAIYWFHQNGEWSCNRFTSKNLSKVRDTTIRDFVNADQLAQIRRWLPQPSITTNNPHGAKELVETTGRLPSELSKMLLLKLKNLWTDMRSFRRSRLKSHDALYEQVAHETEYSLVPFDQLVRTAFGLEFGQLDAPARLSVLLLVFRDPTKMMWNKLSAEATLTVMISPKRLLSSGQDVQQWARRYQQAAADLAKGRDVRRALDDNPLHHFIDKARRIIIRSRQSREANTLGMLSPVLSSAQIDAGNVGREPEEGFSETDKMIVEFIWNTHLRRPRTRVHTHTEAIAALILRAVGAYPEMELDSRASSLFLQELGVLPPWARADDGSVIRPVPGQMGLVGLELDQARSHISELTKNWPVSRNDGPLPIADRMQHLRKDFGDLPVFCIDSHATVVFDDGLSIEACQDRSNAYWVHVHIAHPSAFFDLNHPVSRSARSMGSAVYSAQGVHFMIPPQITALLSIQPGAETFTVSTLLNSAGEVLDVDVVAGRVHNVKYLDVEVVGHFMGEEPIAYATMMIGPGTGHRDWERGQKGPAREDLPATQKHLPLLVHMYKLLQARCLRRRLEVETYCDFVQAVKQKEILQTSANELFVRDSLYKCIHEASDPDITLRRSFHAPERRTSELLMGENINGQASALACESFGRWMNERNLPALFAGTNTVPEWPMHRLNELTDSRDGVLPFRTVGTTPQPHVTLNMRQYARVTSPLRRFTDLMNQWNADAYIRAAAAGKLQSGVSANSLDLPMSTSDIEGYLRHNYWAITHAAESTRLGYSPWSFQAFFRAFKYEEAELPEVFDCQIKTVDPNSGRHRDTADIRGRLYPWGLRAHFRNTDEGYERRALIGQYLPCKIEIVDPVDIIVVMRAVGEATDTPQIEVRDIIGPNHMARYRQEKEREAAMIAEVKQCLSRANASV